MILISPYSVFEHIFEVDAVVNTINAKGYMGKGLALECALRFPEMEKKYKEECRKQKIKAGDVWIYEVKSEYWEDPKKEIRKIAEQNKIPFLKSESQDICFLNEDGKIIDHNDFLKKNIKLKSGPIKTLDNKEIGQHQGLPLYTIGQRKGIEIGGMGPFYALKKDYENNTLYVVDNLNDPSLFSESFVVDNLNWISNISPDLPLECEVVIRYRHKPVKCNIDFLKSSLDLSKEGRKYIVKIHKAQRAISPGQSAVFYKGDELIGGGLIF